MLLISTNNPVHVFYKPLSLPFYHNILYLLLDTLFLHLQKKTNKKKTFLKFSSFKRTEQLLCNFVLKISANVSQMFSFIIINANILSDFFRCIIQKNGVIFSVYSLTLASYLAGPGFDPSRT